MRVATALCLSCLVLTACGGGDGGYPPTPFSGPYWHFELGGSIGGQSEILILERGETYVNQDRSSTSNAEPVGLSPAGPYEGQHRVDPDRALTGLTGWPYSMVGGVSPLGRCAVAGRVSDTVWPKIFVLLGHVGSFRDASLEGVYHLVGFQRRYGQVESIVDCQPEFDGAGAYAAAGATTARHGIVDTVTPASGLGYSVAADGLLTLDDLWGEWLLEGGVLAGGQVAMAAGPTEAEEAGDRILYALLQAATGFSDASFVGPFWTVTMQYGSGETRSTTGTLSPDGAGACVYSFQECIEYGLSTHSLSTRTVPGTYDVSADGALTMTIDGQTLLGGLSPDGAFFALAGGLGTGDRTVFLFGVARE